MPWFSSADAGAIGVASNSNALPLMFKPCRSALLQADVNGIPPRQVGHSLQCLCMTVVRHSEPARSSALVVVTA